MPSAPTLTVFTAPQLAPLRDLVVQRLRDDPLPPLETEVIVVQSQGMRRWLTLQIADALGCAGSLALPFPAHFIYDIANRVLPGPAGGRDDDPFSRDALTWRIDALLRDLPPRERVWQPLREYLRVSDDRMRLGLAARIAARFDEYQLYRHDALLAWERGEETHASPHARWQAMLWRRLCAGSAGGDHLPHRLTRAIEALERGAGAGLPRRVTVFGVSALPPVFLDLLAALSKTVEVRVCAAVLDAACTHPLATAFGAQGRELLELLRERGAAMTRLEAAPTTGTGLLTALQRDIASPSGAADSPAPSRADPTLRIHDCHGRVRQLEVVRDQLLDALAADSTLRPHDLLLLVPDAGEWAPAVDAVFGVAGEGVPVIPFNIADRPRRSVQPAAEAFLRLLALEGGRFARSEVFALLEHPLVRHAARLTDVEVETLRGITERVNVHWGYDATAREALGLPGYEEASWRLGLDRLLLGLLTGRRDELVLEALPAAGDTAGDPEIVGRLASWVDRLADTLLSWRRPRGVAEWSDELLAASETFLGAGDRRGEQAIRDVRGEIRRLAALGGVSGHAHHVPFGVVRDWIESQLGDEGFGAGFLAGGMTVAALKPMRSIPFRVIAVAGLDDDAFPRRDRRAAFDLLAIEPRRGDRDLRHDDRQLFLDLLLAARDRLILAFGGRAVQDNSPRAPSVVLDELLDHLDGAQRNRARDAIVVRHPLQPFSGRYFEERDPRLFTYAPSQARAAHAGAAPGGSQPFVVGPVDAEPVGEITLDELADLWTNPSRYFCRRVLRVALEHDVEDVSDDERLALDAMTQGLVRSRLLAGALAGRDVARERLLLESEGLLPPLALGESWYQRLAGEVKAVLGRVPGGEPVPPALTAVDGDGWRLTGRLEKLRGGLRVVARAGSLRPDHYLRAWVEHVVMCAAREAGATSLPDVTVLISKTEKPERIAPVPDARAVLHDLMGALGPGREAPLPFFPQAGWAWFSQIRQRKKGGKSRTDADPIGRARSAYDKERDPFDPVGGDGEDPYIALCFRDQRPMEDRYAEFERWANLLFGRWPPPERGA